MTDKELTEKFEQLRAAYKKHWLVEDTKAFEKFCFANSDRIAKLLKSVS